MKFMAAGGTPCHCDAVETRRCERSPSQCASSKVICAVDKLCTIAFALQTVRSQFDMISIEIKRRPSYQLCKSQDARLVFLASGASALTIQSLVTEHTLSA